MSETRNPKLFIDDPEADLARLVDVARRLGAGRLLLLAGKYPVCRINGQLSHPLVDEKLHFQQTEALVNALLDVPEKQQLDEKGEIEINRSIASASVNINIFYGDGSHNLVVFLL